jgi:hypothetical protein
MDMMQELLRLDSIGELSGPSAVWFNKTKTEEEFYVVADDPLQLNNQIGNPKYVDEIDRLRNELSVWQEGLNDQSVIPESQMVAEMWPDNKQPITEMPKLEQSESSLFVKCPTEGASIAYQFSDDSIPDDDWNHWDVYNTPLEAEQKNKFLHLQAIRIGYQPSKVLTVEM